MSGTPQTERAASVLVCGLSEQTDPENDSTRFLSEGGEMAALIAAKDWSKTSLGPIERWSPSLRIAG